jgi:hypothetical protein
MASKKRRDLYFGLMLLMVPIAGAVMGALLPNVTNGSAPNAAVDVDQFLSLTDQPGSAPAAPLELAQAEGVRGAPLGAAPTEAAPPAVTIGEEATDERQRMQNMIPKESWDLLKQAEKPVAPEDLYRFDRTTDGKFLKVTFSALGGYKYELPDPEVVRASADPTKPPTQQIPEPLMKIHGEQVVIVGFMVPFDIDRKGNVKSFALTQNQAFCCFGIPPAMNELVMVTMEEGKTAPFLNNIPLAVYGKIEVGEEIDDGYVLSLYRMSASEAIDVKELLRRTNEAAGAAQ